MDEDQAEITRLRLEGRARKAEEQRVQAEKTHSEIARASVERDAKTARLRGLRLARDEELAKAEAERVASKKAQPARKPRPKV